MHFSDDLRKKPKSVKSISMYVSESSHYTLLENDKVYRGQSHHSWDISNWNIKKDVDAAEI